MTAMKLGRAEGQWRFLATLFVLILNVILFFFMAAQSTVYAENTMAEMTEEQIKSLVAERYKAIFGALYIQNPLDQAYVPMPKIAAEDFAVRDETEEVWIVVHDPLVGLIVRASVSKANGLVQFDSIDFAVE